MEIIREIYNELLRVHVFYGIQRDLTEDVARCCGVTPEIVREAIR